MSTGIIISVFVVLICRLGYKKSKNLKILPLNAIDYVIIAIVLFVALFFLFRSMHAS